MRSGERRQLRARYAASIILRSLDQACHVRPSEIPQEQLGPVRQDDALGHATLLLAFGQSSSANSASVEGAHRPLSRPRTNANAPHASPGQWGAFRVLHNPTAGRSTGARQWAT